MELDIHKLGLEFECDECSYHLKELAEKKEKIVLIYDEETSSYHVQRNSKNYIFKR